MLRGGGGGGGGGDMHFFQGDNISSDNGSACFLLLPTYTCHGKAYRISFGAPLLDILEVLTLLNMYACSLLPCRMLHYADSHNVQRYL